MPEESSSIQGSPTLLPGEPIASDCKPDGPVSSTQTNAAKRGTGRDTPRANRSSGLYPADRVIHPSWFALIELCRELGHGEIERLSIQDGLPVLAETVKKKIRFAR